MGYTGRLSLASAMIFLLGFTTHAQSKNGFVGVWEEIGGTNAKGEHETGNAGMRRIFTPDGFYSIVLGRVCPGTPEITSPVPDLTKEQVLDRLRCVIAQDGTFKVDGDKLNITRRPRANTKHAATKQVMQWKIENGELSLKILSDTGQAPVGQITQYKHLAGSPQDGPFVGVWEETHSVNGKGEPGSGNDGMRRIFTADGFYSITYPRQCAGTDEVEGQLKDLTKEQILDRLRCVIAQDGTFSLEGDKLYIHRRSDNNPGNAPSEQTMQWKYENGELSLKIVANNNPVTMGQITYYKRLK